MIRKKITFFLVDSPLTKMLFYIFIAESRVTIFDGQNLSAGVK